MSSRHASDDGQSEPEISEPEISEQELRARVIYALFLPSVRLARHFSVNLSLMKEWLEMAYFHELRREGLKQREVAEVMGVSMSKVSLLSKQLKGNFFQPERQEQALSRRIEFMLWAEPLSSLKLKQVLLDVQEEEIDLALEELKREGRIELEPQGTTHVYRLRVQTDRRVWNSWVARVDGLHDALGNVTNVIYGRFFEGEPRAFARTLSFRLRADRIEALRELYERHVFATIVALDEEAGSAQRDAEECGEPADIEELSISLFWAPYNYLKRRLEASKESP